jgi:hypothetical protein
MHKKLEPFVGTWSYPGKEESYSEICEWFEGGHQVVCRLECINDDNVHVSGMSILGYSGLKKKFTYYGFNSLGRNSYQLGENIGNVFTFIGEGKHNQDVKTLRTTITFSEDFNSAEFITESDNLGKWELIEQETLIKIIK